MPLLDIFPSGKSLAFLRDDVHQPRPTHFAHGGKGVQQRVDIMSIYRTEITKAQFFEQHTGCEKRFHTFFPPAQQCPRILEGFWRTIDNLANLRAQTIVKIIALHRRQILVHRTNGGRDAHFVVVQHDDKIAIGMSGVVERFVCESGGQRAVANNCRNLESLTIQVATGCHSQRRRY